MNKVFIVNVGVHSGHKPLRSLRFEDETFEFVTIPENEQLRYEKSPQLVHYADLEMKNDIRIEDIIRERYLKQVTHHDPEFHTYTYGDTLHQENGRAKARSINLAKAESGDILLFYARLVDWIDGSFTSRAGFYFIGFLEIDRVFDNITKRPTPDTYRRLKRNSHIIRAEYLGYENPFWVFSGTKESKRLKYALPFNKQTISKMKIRRSNGKPLNWNKHPSELAAIGRYFRAIRIIDKQPQLGNLMDYIDDREGY